MTTLDSMVNYKTEQYNQFYTTTIIEIIITIFLNIYLIHSKLGLDVCPM